MKLKLITIDFWNTLFDSSNGEERNNQRIKTLLYYLDKVGHYVKRDDIEAGMKATWFYFNRIWEDERRTPTPRELVEFFWKRLDAPDRPDYVEKIIENFSETILSYPPSIMDGAKSILPKLKKKYKLAIVSDTGFSPGKVVRRLMKEQGVYDYFEAFSFSDETGVSKPHNKAFEAVLQPLEANPEEALHIGDIEGTDVIGAKNIGMKAIRFAGDSTSIVAEKNPDSTIADAICHSWAEVLTAIQKIENNEKID